MAENSTPTDLPPAARDLLTRLTAEGFTPDASVHAVAVERGVPLSHNGAYVVLAAVSRAGVSVVVEQNTAPEVPGGDSITTYPPVARISGPRGGASARAADIPAVLAVIADVDVLA